MTARARLFAAAVVAGIMLCNAAAPAAVNFSTGIRYVMPTGTAADCSAKAKAALGKYLQDPTESSTGSGEWLAFGPVGANGPQSYTSAATVRCYGLDQGYVVTFTCVVQTPDSPYTAGELCLDIAHNFSGKPETVLATPSPMPTGCTSANLIGTWVSDDRSGPTLTMTADGELTDQDGVSGNWVLYGTSATLTYYGNHNLTLSADGKHLRGQGYSLTRKC
jgi:hypothetical protein